MDMYFHQATQFHVCPGRPFSIDEIQYPDNWLNLATPAEIAALGLVPVATVGEAKDPTYQGNRMNLIEDRRVGRGRNLKYRR